MCPYDPQGDTSTSLNFGRVFDQFGIVERIDSVKGQPEPLREVTVKLHRTAWLEQDRVELHAITEIRLIIVSVPDNAFTSLAHHVEPIEQVLDGVGQYSLIGTGRLHP